MVQAKLPARQEYRRRYSEWTYRQRSGEDKAGTNCKSSTHMCTTARETNAAGELPLNIYTHTYTTTRDTDAAGELPLNIHTHTYTPPRVRQTAAGELPLNIHTYTYTPPHVRQMLLASCL